MPFGVDETDLWTIGKRSYGHNPYFHYLIALLTNILSGIIQRFERCLSRWSLSSTVHRKIATSFSPFNASLISPFSWVRNLSLNDKVYWIANICILTSSIRTGVDLIALSPLLSRPHTANKFLYKLGDWGAKPHPNPFQLLLYSIHVRFEAHFFRSSSASAEYHQKLRNMDMTHLILISLPIFPNFHVWIDHCLLFLLSLANQNFPSIIQ